MGRDAGYYRAPTGRTASESRGGPVSFLAPSPREVQQTGAGQGRVWSPWFTEAKPFTPGCAPRQPGPVCSATPA